MKESEAKTKWCPFLQIIVAMGYMKRPDPNESSVTCISSGCAWWRKTHSAKMNSAGALWWVEDGGYCGLAGKES